MVLIFLGTASDFHDFSVQCYPPSRAKRPAVNRAQLQARVRSIMGTRKAKDAARNCARGLKKVCDTVQKNGGKASRG